jgi:hypothetical protein
MMSPPRHLTLALLVLAACDTSGIHALGRLRDALVPCDSDPLGRTLTTSTWLRSTDEGVEVLLFGRPDPTAEFIAIIRNDFTVNVQSLLDPNTDITYRQFEELTGIVIDGLQRTDVNTSGEGSMSGVLSFVMRGTDRVLRGRLDYEGLGIDNGVAASGTYTMSLVGGDPRPISFELATDVDLQAVLPVEAP